MVSDSIIFSYFISSLVYVREAETKYNGRQKTSIGYESGQDVGDIF
jgi:hypothetical protein